MYFLWSDISYITSLTINFIEEKYYKMLVYFKFHLSYNIISLYFILATSQ